MANPNGRYSEPTERKNLSENSDSRKREISSLRTVEPKQDKPLSEQIRDVLNHYMPTK